MKERKGSISYNIKEALEKKKVDYCDWKLAVNTLRKTVQGQAAFMQICEVAQLHVSPTNTAKQQIIQAVLLWWESIKKSTKKSTNKTARNTNAKSCIPKPSRKLRRQTGTRRCNATINVHRSVTKNMLIPYLSSLYKLNILDSEEHKPERLLSDEVLDLMATIMHKRWTSTEVGVKTRTHYFCKRTRHTIVENKPTIIENKLSVVANSLFLQTHYLSTLTMFANSLTHYFPHSLFIHTHYFSTLTIFPHSLFFRTHYFSALTIFPHSLFHSLDKAINTVAPKTESDDATVHQPKRVEENKVTLFVQTHYFPNWCMHSLVKDVVKTLKDTSTGDFSGMTVKTPAVLLLGVIHHNDYHRAPIKPVQAWDNMNADELRVWSLQRILTQGSSLGVEVVTVSKNANDCEMHLQADFRADGWAQAIWEEVHKLKKVFITLIRHPPSHPFPAPPTISS